MVVAGRCQLSPISPDVIDPLLEGNAIARSPFRI